MDIYDAARDIRRQFPDISWASALSYAWDCQTGRVDRMESAECAAKREAFFLACRQRVAEERYMAKFHGASGLTCVREAVGNVVENGSRRGIVVAGFIQDEFEPLPRLIRAS